MSKVNKGTSEVRFWFRAGRNKLLVLEEFERLKAMGQTVQDESQFNLTRIRVDGKSDLKTAVCK